VSPTTEQTIEDAVFTALNRDESAEDIRAWVEGSIDTWNTVTGRKGE
jgi:hypothetical protein